MKRVGSRIPLQPGPGALVPGQEGGRPASQEPWAGGRGGRLQGNVATNPFHSYIFLYLSIYLYTHIQNIYKYI